MRVDEFQLLYHIIKSQKYIVTGTCRDMFSDRDYYITMIYPDGKESGPTRMLMIDSDKQALPEMRKYGKRYPDCEFVLEREGNGTYATWRVEAKDKTN